MRNLKLLNGHSVGEKKNMDPISIITGVLGGLGFITSIVSILYVRQQAQSAKEQVTIATQQMKIMSEEAGRKKSFAIASKAIIQVIDGVKTVPKKELITLDLSCSNIIRYLHDNHKSPNLTLSIYPQLFHELKNAEQSTLLLR
jgi:hypothetical protein